MGDGGTLEDGITVVFDYERMNIRALCRPFSWCWFWWDCLQCLLTIQGILRKIGVGGHGACGTLTEPFLVEETGRSPMLASRGIFISGAGIYLLAGGIRRRQLGKCQQKLWFLQYHLVFSVLCGHLCGDRPGGLGGSHC